MEKKRNLAGFGDVANTNNNNNNNININDNIDINSNKNIIDNIINPTKQKKEMVGIYFDPDVADALERIGKSGGRGAKSRVVNDIIRAYLEQNGFI